MCVQHSVCVEYSVRACVCVCVCVCTVKCVCMCVGVGGEGEIMCGGGGV